jgi:NAD(P)-dependent dehydrogenase (short-subunit alcohol dehydrogenase family)
MSELLKNRVAVVTGGAAGFGLSATERFVANGARVVIADIDAAAGAAAQQRLGSAVRFVQTDVRRESDLREAVGAAMKHFGGLDVMYHNAGTVGTPAGIEDMEAAPWNAAMDMLLTSSMLAIKVSVEPMKARGGGSIILTSSGAGVRLGGSGPLAYSTAKAAVLMLGQHCALKLGKHRIRVNTLVPGAFRTALWDKHALGIGMLAENKFALMQPLPIEGNPRHIADAALFLACDMSEFVTGIVLPVDGGMTLHRNSHASIEG